LSKVLSIKIASRIYLNLRSFAMKKPIVSIFGDSIQLAVGGINAG